jgi:hypothetical protein
MIKLTVFKSAPVGALLFYGTITNNYCAHFALHQTYCSFNSLKLSENLLIAINAQGNSNCRSGLFSGTPLYH